MVLMLVSFIPTQSVSQCPLVYIPDGSARKIINDSHPAKTIDAHSRARSFDVLNEFDWIVEPEVILLLVDKKIDCFSVQEVCNHGNTVFEAMGCY